MLAFNEAFRSVSGLGMIEIDILNIVPRGTWCSPSASTTSGPTTAP
jgi:hypothetical protein